MANISQNVNIEMLEKLPDGTYKRKYPKTRADDGTTFDEHLAENALLGDLAEYGISVNQSIIGNGGYVKVNFDSVKKSTVFTELSNGSVKVLKSGLYQVIFNCQYAANPDSWRQLVIGEVTDPNRVVTRTMAVNGIDTIIQITHRLKLNANDLITCQASQNANIPINILPAYTRVIITKEG